MSQVWLKPNGTNQVNTLLQGKSTLANLLLGHERSLTGPEPGLTRDAVHGWLQWEGRPVCLVDTAGWMKRSRLHNYDDSG